MGRGEKNTSVLELLKVKAPESRGTGRPRHSILQEEAMELAHRLTQWEELLAIADEHDDDAELQAQLDEVAWREVDAHPVRIKFAADLLQLTGPTVREWAERGVLEKFDRSGPIMLDLGSVLLARELADELRELGQDTDLVNAVLNRLEMAELETDGRFQRSLEQMRRGERGQFPDHW